MRHEKYRQYNLYESGLNAVSGVISSDYIDIYEIIASNMSSSALYFQIFDTGSLPVNGDIPRRSYYIDSNSSLSISWREGREYKTGSVFAWSSTYGTLSTGSFTQVSVDVDYKGPWRY